MPTDYILFVHGVKTRNEENFYKLCNTLLSKIKAIVRDETRILKPICFFWGDLNLDAQSELLAGFEASPRWRDFWFRKFRTEQVLEFVGDAALYLSRHIGSQIVRRFKDEALGLLESADRDDRLHLVTHSLGTVILFDILFARRWEDLGLDADESSRGIRQVVEKIRKTLYGLSPNPQSGISLTSIHMMGSPLALFSLLNISGNVNGASSHDLSPGLRSSLEQLHSLRNKPIPWRNFAHPGDPIAYPLEGVIPLMLKESTQYVDVLDVITDKGNIFNLPFSQQLLPLAWGGEAHGSYWNNELVAREIGKVIQSAI